MFCKISHCYNTCRWQFVLLFSDPMTINNSKVGKELKIMENAVIINVKICETCLKWTEYMKTSPNLPRSQEWTYAYFTIHVFLLLCIYLQGVSPWIGTWNIQYDSKRQNWVHFKSTVNIFDHLVMESHTVLCFISMLFWVSMKYVIMRS